QPVGEAEDFGVGEAAILVALQHDAAAAAHLGDLLDPADQELAVVAEQRHDVAVDRDADLRQRSLPRHQHLLARARLRQRLLAGGDEAAPVAGGEEELLLRAVGEQRDDVVLVWQVDHQAQRLAMAASAGQPVDRQRIETPVAAEDDDAVGGLRRHDEARPVAFLVLDLGGGAVMPLHRADPALFRAQHGDGLALDQRLDGHQYRRWRRADLGAPLAERGGGTEFLPGLADLPGDRLPLPLVLGEQAVDLALLAFQTLQLLAQLDLLELAQRAQAHVEDGLGLGLAEIPARHQLGPGLVALADDADDLVEIEIDDDL